jgi:hypothetical protein
MMASIFFIFRGTSQRRKTGPRRLVAPQSKKHYAPAKARPMPISWAKLLPLNPMTCKPAAKIAGGLRDTYAQIQSDMHKNKAGKTAAPELCLSVQLGLQQTPPGLHVEIHA